MNGAIFRKKHDIYKQSQINHFGKVSAKLIIPSKVAKAEVDNLKLEIMKLEKALADMTDKLAEANRKIARLNTIVSRQVDNAEKLMLHTI